MATPPQSMVLSQPSLWVHLPGILSGRCSAPWAGCSDASSLPPVIRRAIDAALLKREPYLVMVVRPDGVADGAIVVAVVHALLMIPWVLDGIGVLTATKVILYGILNWIILSGLVYLIGKYLLEGDGSFPGTMAATSIGYPVLLVGILLAPFAPPLRAQLIVSAWLVATVWVAARVALELSKARAAAAAVGGWVAFVVVSLILRF